jgi:hypothetical protein
VRKIKGAGNPKKGAGNGIGWKISKNGREMGSEGMPFIFSGIFGNVFWFWL